MKRVRYVERIGREENNDVREFVAEKPGFLSGGWQLDDG